MIGFLLAACLAAPDVIFLSVDTLRADALGCYGYERDTSPHLDQFAQNGLVFEDCVCEVPLTAPSFGSMLTSRFPRMNSTHRNGLRLPDGIPSVAQVFKKAGYQTFCVQSNWTLKADMSGLDRGFDTYDDDFHKKRWGVLKSERYADEVTERALALLERRDPDKPLFLWIHYSDPHAPYRFHRNFNPAGRQSLLADKASKIRAEYDSEVAYTDHWMSKVLEALPAEETCVLFVADHGESLYEHDYLGHGRRIYQTGLHIPLIIWGPGVEPGRTATPARGVDIGPTLLGLAGLSPLPGMLGLDLLHAAVPEPRPRVIETYGGAVPRMPGAEAMMAGRPPMRQGALADGWKLILGGDRPELFNLGEDPRELTNLAHTDTARLAALRTLVEKWDKATPKTTEEDADLSEDDMEALESLGYL